MNPIHVFYSSIKDPGLNKPWIHLLKQFPVSWKDYILKFEQEKDKKRSFLARYMLLKILNIAGYGNDIELSFNKWGKPYLEDGPLFNWSHSGEWVVMVFHNQLSAGIDIEIIKEIEWKEFQSSFHPYQWNEILTSENPLIQFYSYWTINEAIIKAEGFGFSLDTKKILPPESEIVYLNNNYYRIKEVIIDDQHLCHVAAQTKDYKIKTNRFTLEQP